MKQLQLTVITAGLIACLYGASPSTQAQPTTEIMEKLDVAVFDENGALELPKDIDTWIFMGSTIGMTYFEGTPDPEDPGLSSTVLLEPRAYQIFLRTGKFPDGTVFAKVVRDTVISDGGYSLGEELGIEFHVKDKDRYPQNGFNFFFFQSGQAKAPAMPEDNICVSCHQEKAAYDNVFTQFYPPIRSKLEQ